jgi:excisionase family DNA binding protein
MSEFMRAAEVARLLGVTERRVYQMMESGQLDYRGRRPRRISRDSFGRYLEGRWPQLINFMGGRA